LSEDITKTRGITLIITPVRALKPLLEIYNLIIYLKIIFFSDPHDKNIKEEIMVQKLHLHKSITKLGENF
jgi:hypothetical protein